MNPLWYTDGLSRRQYEERREALPGGRMLEDSFPALMGRAVDMMHRIHYFDANGLPTGAFYSLFRFQPIVILTEIHQLDANVLALTFRREYEAGRDSIRILYEELEKRLTDWAKRLAYCRELRLTHDLWGWMVGKGELLDRAALKKKYYSLLEIVRRLQRGYDVYFEEIVGWGKNDPAMAVLVTFLRNYGEVAARFNARWEELPAFFFEKILRVDTRKPVPDKTWLTLLKNPGVADVPVEKGTAFVAGKLADGSLFCYRSTERIRVEDIQLGCCRSYLLEKDRGRFPAARLGYVTAVLGNELDLAMKGEPQEMFGGSRGWFEPLGLLIESPMFLLREGIRNVELTFNLTRESVAFFSQLVEEIATGQSGQAAELEYKILHDAFYLEISTGEGWTVIPDYILTREPESCFRLQFRLNRDFPATGPCRSERHQNETRMPALRIRMNRDAWLFPYSWARQVFIDKLVIRTEVTGITALKLYNANGEQDTSVPVYLLGVQPERGSWFVFGNEEMACKPLTDVALSWQWLQLPDHPEGLAGYYREYGEDIDNRAFRVRLEELQGRKWQECNSQYLFAPEAEQELAAIGALPRRSRMVFPVKGYKSWRENGREYVYGQVEDGFFRVVLEGPELGFGHTAYRRLFAEIMMQNARRKRPLPLPSEPLSPLSETFELCYVAEEELCFAPGQRKGATRLRYICPLTSAGDLEVSPVRAVALANGPADEGNLLFGFKQAVGYDSIRLYVDVAPLQQEIDFRDTESGENAYAPVWYMTGSKGWKPLEAGAVLQDTTGHFMNSGKIEILLPHPVAPHLVDSDGLFWLCAAFPGYMGRKPAIRGIYMNTVEVVSDTVVGDGVPDWVDGVPAGTITSPVNHIPGIAAICQLVSGCGGRLPGDAAEIRLRMSDRIAHRNRAVVAPDFERLVMEHFPEVMKVKCLPGLDTKGLGRKGIVSLVVVPRPQAGLWPLSTHQLLLKIEKFVQERAGAFVVVDAVNPVYEHITVRCGITLEAGVPSGEVVTGLKQLLNQCIASWLGEDGLPQFGYYFSLKSLQNAILENPGIRALHGLSVLQITSAGEQLWQLSEYGAKGQDGDKIAASCPWCVMVPADDHIIEIGDTTDWELPTGVGKLEIGDTLVIAP